MSHNLLNLSLATFLFFSILLHFLGTTRSDDSCPYPCYPPPTGTGSTPTTPSGTTLPPPSPSQSGSSYPPPSSQSGSSYPPPSGYLPYNPPPSYASGSGGGFNGGTPPPPDPIVPYFPFYFKKPPHQTEASSAITLHKWTVMIATTNLFVFLFLFSVCVT
ncbi:leucine-rich repeat extensin-like protein 5 [Quillaja saponaria]|uniref:Leucine-rich repeat extensin-like protein 5 n=1 Tax=Quillaja saponaria TaxID=32244 RepID=A0AAD7KNB1_QUISA|nr:leucine-rich repeat extensin-like protein 5 [Quillaja saponaria]KAJ7943014.1 leucine-rich repeat extensin-like protein 5 [Quillaja saponaria]